MSTPSPTFTILYFASASSYTRLESEQLPAPLPLSRLFQTLEARYHGITAKVLKGCAVTVNLEYADVPVEEDGDGGEGGEIVNGEGLVINEGDEVGIIPPVSSG